MKMKYGEFFTLCFFVLFSMGCGLYLALGGTQDETYAYIALLPFVFGICSILFANVYTALGKNVGLTCLHYLMFIRLVIAPLFMALSGFHSVFRGLSRDEVSFAVGLLCYECFAVYFVFFYMVAKGKKSREPETYTLHYQRPNQKFRMIVFAMSAFCLLVWVAIPSCRELYRTVFEFSDEDFTTVLYAASDEQVGSLSRILLTLFKMAFDIVRIVVPMYILIMFKRRGVSTTVAFMTGILFAFVQLLFISSTTARAIICAFLIIYFLSRLYPRHAKRIMRTAIAAALLVVVAFFVIRFTVGSRYGSNPVEYISKILNAYFCGLDNVAAGIDLPEGYEFSTFWASLYSAIPFNSTLFGLKVVKLQAIYNDFNVSYGQIPPMIIEGYYYFGALLAPVMSCIFAAVAYKYGEKFSQTNSAWHLVADLFIAVLCAISVVMYNEEIVLGWLTEWLLPMKILSWLADKETSV